MRFGHQRSVSTHQDGRGAKDTRNSAMTPREDSASQTCDTLARGCFRTWLSRKATAISSGASFPLTPPSPLGESLHDSRMAHWDREPPRTSPSPCPLPAARGEGGRRPGEGRWMGRENRPRPWDQADAQSLRLVPGQWADRRCLQMERSTSEPVLTTVTSPQGRGQG